MDISIFFQPITPIITDKEGTIGQSIFSHTEGAFPLLKEKGVAIMHVPEYKKSKDSSNNTDHWRAEFYTLFQGKDWEFSLYDLGTILPGSDIKDTYYAVSAACTHLIKLNIIPIVIGGSQDLLLPMYKGYSALEQQINICNIDYKFDLGDPNEEANAEGYISQLLMERPCMLFNYANIGSQNPYISQIELNLMEKLYFDVCRLGDFNADFKIAEPHLRNADLIAIDLKSIRKSEIGSPYENQNGFYMDQMCQIAKYAGISDKASSFGIFNVLKSEQTAHVIKEILWYFLDGVANRKGDFPIGLKKDYKQFNVLLDEIHQEIKFYKSNKSERWWMEVPYPSEGKGNFIRNHMVPCNHSDYELAMKGEIPDLWWKTYQKILS